VTVQAPHPPSPQTSLVPVRRRSSWFWELLLVEVEKEKGECERARRFSFRKREGHASSLPLSFSLSLFLTPQVLQQRRASASWGQDVARPVDVDDRLGRRKGPVGVGRSGGHHFREGSRSNGDEENERNFFLRRATPSPIEIEKEKPMLSSRASSHASASTSSGLSCAAAFNSRAGPSGPTKKRQSAPLRALPEQEKVQLRSNRDRGLTSSTSTSSSFFAALALSASLFLSPPPSFAENVRVEDVKSPALRAGLEAANEQRWADAERLFKTFLLEEPDSASGLSNLANVELSTGRPQQALEHFDRAVALAPGAAVPRMNRALAKEALAVAAAATTGRKGASSSSSPPPSSSSASSSSSSSSSAALLLASAAEDARAASQLDPREFAAFFDLGNILERQRDFEGALAAFAEAADLAPGLPGYRLREAAAMFQVAVDREENGGGDREGGGAAAAAVAKKETPPSSSPSSSSSSASASVAKARKLVAGVTRKNPRYAEAKAALAAMSWRAGDVPAAEDALSSAVSLEGGWRKSGFAAESTRWPPRLVEAYERLLAIK